MPKLLARSLLNATLVFSALVAVIGIAAPLSAQTVQNWNFKILDDNDPTAAAGTTSATALNDPGTAVGSFLSGNFTRGLAGQAARISPL